MSDYTNVLVQDIISQYNYLINTADLKDADEDLYKAIVHAIENPKVDARFNGIAVKQGTVYPDIAGFYFSNLVGRAKIPLYNNTLPYQVEHEVTIDHLDR